MDKVMTCLWFDSRAEEAAKFYVSVFGKGSKITETTYYDDETASVSKKEPGSVLTVTFNLRGRDFMIMNGGPFYKLTPAASLIIDCADQKEVDYFWGALTEGGQQVQCGWLTDRYGLSWQVVPREFVKLSRSKDREKVKRMNAAMMKMVKLDMAELKRAFNG